MCCLQKVASLEKDRGSHDTCNIWDALAAAEQHPGGNNDAVKAGAGVHIEGSQGSPTKARYFKGHHLEHHSPESMAVWTAIPLVIVKRFVSLGFLYHSKANNQTL